MILVSDWLGLTSGSQMKNEAVDAFEIVIQLGAILAVIGLYRRRVGQMVLGVAGKDRDGLRLLCLLMVAFVPAAVVGLPLHKWIQAKLFHPLPVVAALAVGGVLMIVVEQLWKRRKSPLIKGLENVRLEHALVIGVAQILAMWPGTSRSMITILAGLVVGLDMLTAAEFSFLLALPTLGAATLYEGFKSRQVLAQVVGLDGCLIGLVVSGIVAALAVKMFVRYLTSHGLLPFGIYRIIAAAAVYLSLR
jgi:undecaprenyl-diphosphatase